MGWDGEAESDRRARPGHLLPCPSLLRTQQERHEMVTAHRPRVCHTGLAKSYKYGQSWTKVPSIGKFTMTQACIEADNIA